MLNLRSTFSMWLGFTSLFTGSLCLANQGYSELASHSLKNAAALE